MNPDLKKNFNKRELSIIRKYHRLRRERQRKIKKQKELLMAAI
jgi:hypothetical protein